MKYLVILLSLALISMGVYSLSSSNKLETYTVHPSKFSKPVTVEAKAQVIAVVLNQTIFIKNDKTHCLNKVLFWSFKTGYVNCGHQAGEDVYHVFGNDNLPKNIHFSLRELNL